MAITPLEKIKSWFKTSDKPTQGQFWNTWDSFWHKLEKISIDAIDGLQTILSKKVDYTQFAGHLNDTDNPHEVTAEKIGAVSINALENEKSERITADDELRRQIIAFESLTAIRGSVNYYYDLIFNLDTSKLIDGDSYIVLDDDMGYSAVYTWINSNWVHSGRFGRFETSIRGSVESYYELERQHISNLKEGDSFIVLNDENTGYTTNIYTWKWNRWQWESEMKNKNIGNTDISQTDPHRFWDLQGNNIHLLNFGSLNSEIQTVSNNINVLQHHSESGTVHFDNLNLETSIFEHTAEHATIRFNTMFLKTPDIYIETPEAKNAFLWVNEYGAVKFIDVEQLKQILGI